jgi:hypothetical protein
MANTSCGLVLLATFRKADQPGGVFSSKREHKHISSQRGVDFVSKSGLGLGPQPQLDYATVGPAKRSDYVSVRIYFMARPHSQETMLSTAKTQASDIGPPKLRPLSAQSRLAIANRIGDSVSYPVEYDSQSMKEDHRPVSRMQIRPEESDVEARTYFPKLGTIAN